MPTNWKDARRLLCVRLDTIGDVLMTGPALRALRAAAPGRRVSLLTSPAGARIAEPMPEVDEAIAYEAPWMKPPRAGGEPGPELEPGPDLAMVELLRRRRFHAAAIFTVYSQSALPAALLCHLAGIPLRLAHCRENPYGLLTDWVRESEPEQGVRHEVRRQLELVAAVGAPAAGDRLALAVPGAARELVDRLLAEAGVDRDAPWAVVHPGATAPSRRYPAELWAEVCRTLARDHGVSLVFSGGGDEAGLVEEVRAASGAPGASFAGRLDLVGLGALLAAAPVLLAGNTGPVHVAAAVGCPVVDVYALTNPQHSPWGVPARVLYRDVPCRWCQRSVCPQGHHLCLRGVPPGDVVAAALELLRDPRGCGGGLPAGAPGSRSA